MKFELLPIPYLEPCLVVIYMYLQAQVYRDEMVHESEILNITFPTDGIYQCELHMTSHIDHYNESFTFVVQYAIESIIWGLANADDSYDPLFTSYETLWAEDGFVETFTFAILRENGLSLPTNVSWTLEFGHGVEHSSVDLEYITEDDNTLSPSTISSYTHTISLPAEYTVGGDFTATLTLWNLISNLTQSINYTIYEEIYMPNIDSIIHKVRTVNGN